MAAGGGGKLNPARRSTPRWRSPPRSLPRPPLSVAMTKLTINRLAHALDDLASHMDVDQFALASMSEDHKEGVEAFLAKTQAAVQGQVGWRDVAARRSALRGSLIYRKALA